VPALTELVRVACGQFQELTGRKVESVSGVQRRDDGWELTIETVELERVPASTSLLGTYLLQADGQGQLLEYHRRARYYRNRADEDAGA
jgi:hypothetical protein